MIRARSILGIDGAEITELAPFSVEGRLIYTAPFDPSVGPRRLTGKVEDPPPMHIVDSATQILAPAESGASPAEIALTSAAEEALEPDPVTRPIRIVTPAFSTPRPASRLSVTASSFSRTSLAVLFLFGVTAGLLAALAFGRGSRE